MKIRKAVLTDVEGIAKVQVDTWRTTYQGMVPDDYLSSLSYEKRAQVWTNVISNQSLVFVAENKEGKVVGFISGGKVRFDKYSSYTGELYAIYILKEYQKLSFGKELVKKLVHEFLVQDINSMIVIVLKDNPAKIFYQKLGGVYIDEREDQIGDKQVMEHVYAWEDVRTILDN